MGDQVGGGAAERTRLRFIEAGWAMLDQVSFADALAGVTVAEIAGFAGKSERTFWNHFPDWEGYMEALQTAIPRRGPMEDEAWGAVDAVDEALVGPSREVLPSLVRAAAEANWAEVNQPEEMVAFRRQLMLASRAAAHGGLPEVLGHDYYGLYLPRLQAIYEAAGATARMAPVRGFTWSHFTRILAALAEGLAMQSLARQNEVDAEFVADALTITALGLVAPAEDEQSIEGCEAAVAAQPAPVEQDDELVALALRCRPAIVEGELRWARVAHLTGLSELDARVRFQRLSVVAALAFAHHDELLGHHLPESPGLPVRRVVELLCALTRTARDDATSAHALLSERLNPDGDRRVVTQLVPLGAAVAAAAGEPLRSVHERLVNTTISGALTDHSAGPVEIATAALGAHRSLAASLADVGA